MDPEQSLWRTTAQETVAAAPLDGDAACDLAVIGGGFSGCAAALAAAERGASVRLLEAQAPGHGGSGRNVGLVNAGLWTPPADIEAQLGAEAGRHLNAALAAAPETVFGLIERHAIRCDPVRAGTLHCAPNHGGVAELRRRHRQLADRGAPVTLLERAEVSHRTGAEGLRAGLFDPRAGTINPLAYCRGLARAAGAAGAMLHGDSPVRRVARAGGAWRVDTPGGTVTARHLLVATNAYHRGIAGLAPPQYATVHYFQAATRPLTDNLRRLVLAGGEGAWDTNPVMTSFRLDAAGRLLLGAVGALTGAGAGIHRAWARRKLARLFPALADQPFEAFGHGKIAMTSDHLPKITRLGGGAGYVLHGYSGRGIGPGTVFGTAVAQALLDGREDRLPIPPVTAYREPASGLKTAYYESGAALTHLTER